MITRAQAEALLTLAESLEACERQELGLAADQFGTVWLRAGDPSNDAELNGLSPMDIRLAVNALIPKQEITYTLNWEERP